MSITKFPKERIFPQAVKPREMYAQAEPTEAMVWEVCPYLRMHLDESRCHHCPKYKVEDGLEHHGKMMRGCYGLAREVCLIVFAMQARDGQYGGQK